MENAQLQQKYLPTTFLRTKYLRSEYLRTTLLLTAASFVLPFSLCVILVTYLTGVQQREIANETQFWGQAFTTKLQGRLEANMALGRGIDAQISVLGDISQADLEALAPRLLEPDLNIRHIAVAPDLIVSAVYPLIGNEAVLGLDYTLNPEQSREALKALSLNTIVLAGPLNLVQGTLNQLVARFPVFSADGSVWGLVAIVIDVPGLVKGAGSDVLMEKFDVALRKVTDQEEALNPFFGEPALFAGDAQIFSLAVPGGSWQLALRPVDGWQIASWLQVSYWAVALFVCLLISCATFLYRKAAFQQKNYLQRLETVLAVDPLTKLMTRYKFNEHLAQFVEESKENNKGFTVLLIDLDHFKGINDSLGHHAGDQLIAEVARRLESSVRSDDLVGRLGGDEFIVVLKDVHRAVEIESRAFIISSKLADKLQVADVEVSVTCSMGAAVYPVDGDDANSLIQHADLAMFESKRAGRNTLFFFNPSQRKEADRYVNLHAELKSAISFGELLVYYQPIYNVKGKSFSHCEALTRWPKADGSFISPMEFIPVAEQSGLISDMGLWLVEEVCRCCESMMLMGQVLNFSLNRSPNEFSSVHHGKQLVALVNKYNIPRQQITLEITESLFMSDNSARLKNFQTLKAQGFNFSIDDFGTGYSAISYLRKFPVGSLKIDKSFIAELGQSSQADTLVKVIIQLAKTLDIAVVAEGVETKQQFDILCNMGCDYLQGYFLAKPMPESEFKAFIAESQTNPLWVHGVKPA